VGWTNPLLRVCVPLFVMITGFFLFPIEDERKFFRKRFTRVVIPFVIWCAAERPWSLSVKQRTGNAISHIRVVVKGALRSVVACLALLLSWS